MRHRLMCAAVLAAMAGVPHAASADGPAISAEAARALANIEADRGNRTAEDRRAAERLTVLGDRAFEVGLALAQRDSAFQRKHPALTGRALGSAACLQAVAAEIETAAPRSCVDIAKLRACLGEPLLK